MSDEGLRLEIKGATLKTDFAQLISSSLALAAHTLVAAKTGGIGLALMPNIISGFFGALKAFKHEETPEIRAWLLISGGILFAIEKTIGELDLEKPPSATALKQLADDLTIRVATKTYIIKPTFFSNPNGIALLEDVSHELSCWLPQFGATDSHKAILARLERHFPAGLHRTWMKDSARFETIEIALNSPFVQAMQAQHEFEGYLQYILRKSSPKQDSSAKTRMIHMG